MCGLLKKQFYGWSLRCSVETASNFGTKKRNVVHGSIIVEKFVTFVALHSISWQEMQLGIFLLCFGFVYGRPKSSDVSPVTNNITAGPTGTGRQPFIRISSESRRSEGLDFCRKAAKCQTLNYTTCLGTKLPYSQTSLELIADSHTQEDVQVFY